VSCDIIGDVASLTGWPEDHIQDMPLHRALYYQLKHATQRGQLCEWTL
jgi:hypothetical protein